MNELQEIKDILKLVKTEVDTHLKFKQKYNKQFALDFSLFDFFKVGENKVSQLLAYFLDTKENHGQGDVFLREFVKQFYKDGMDITQYENTTEKTTYKYRRIDIYIKLEDITIAIENKPWADDQVNQLLDYSDYLDTVSNGKYLLLYLTPYGNPPSVKSIEEDKKNKLLHDNKLKLISYKEDIIPLIDKWIIICEADNVIYFLREFKKYLETTFLGKNTLNMSNELRRIIRDNKGNVKKIVNEYNGLVADNTKKLNSIGKKLNERIIDMEYGLKLEKVGPFNYEGRRFYKFSISNEKNKIWVQLYTKDLDIGINYYLDGTDAFFKTIIEHQKNNIHTHFQEETEEEIIEVFLEKVKIVMDCFDFHKNLIEDADNKLSFEESCSNERFVLSIARQYQNQGLSLSKLLEVGKRGLEKAEIRTQGLKDENKKQTQVIWFIRQEILNELNG